MASTMEIYPRQLDIESHTSALMDRNAWKSQLEKYTVKYRRLDIEHREIEFYYVMSTGTLPEMWTHIFDSTDSTVYRITGIRQGPVAKGSLNNSAIITLEMDALASWYVNTPTGMTHRIGGRWSRLPMQAVVEPFQVRPAQMMIASETAVDTNIPLMKAGALGTLKTAYWMEVNASKNGEMVTYGFFVIPGGSNILEVNNSPMPTLDEAITNPAAYLGVSASAIVSMSISYRCPYYCVFDHSNHAIIWEENETAMAHSNYASEALPDSNPTRYAFIRHNGKNYAETSVRTMDVTVTDDQINCGSITVKDATSAVVGHIDTRYADKQNHRLRLKVRTYSDGTMITTELSLSDGTIIRYPEGSIPFSGSSYGEYTIAQLGYDRQIMAINQQKAMSNAAVGMSGAVANGAIASIGNGGIGLATAAVGVAGTALGTVIDYNAAEREMSAKIELMKNTPDTLYNTGYGFSYLQRTLEGLKPRVSIAMPSGVASSEITDYVKHHGYPVTDVPLTITKTHFDSAAESFLQGEVDDVGASTITIYGERRRILERQLRAGVHFKVIT